MSSPMKTNVLVGGWPVYSEAHGLNKKETPDTFTWMKGDDCQAYEDIRAAVTSVDGGREWLSSFSEGSSTRSPIASAIADKASPLHSGGSFNSILRQYSLSLRNWDKWVKEVKEDSMRRSYKKEQVTPYLVRRFLSDMRPYFTDGKGEAELIAGAYAKNPITFSDGRVITTYVEAEASLAALADEFDAWDEEDRVKEKSELMRSRVSVLEWNMNHPVRWFWPGEGNPNYCITEEEKEEMERLHPGYRGHLRRICAEFNSQGGVIRDPWSRERTDALHARLVVCGILPTE